MQTQTRPKAVSTSTQPLHKFVLLGAGVWMMFVLTFAIAYYRVGSSQKYNGTPFKSLTDTETHKPTASYN